MSFVLFRFVLVFQKTEEGNPNLHKFPPLLSGGLPSVQKHCLVMVYSPYLLSLSF